MADSLKFGDTVLFHVQTKEQNGFIYAELSSSPYNFLTLFPIENGLEKEPGFPNVKFAAFTVLAPNKYKAKQRLKDLQQRPDHEEHQVVRAMEALVTEDFENNHEQMRKLGTNVSFGDTIQLRHAASHKYVTVCSEAAKTESNNLLVSLLDENSEGAIFKILPKFKVRSEGDYIRYGDQLKLESAKTQGQFLHTSSPSRNLKAAGFNILTNCFEVNLSSNDTALILVRHQSPPEDGSEKVLQAGSCIQLFHKEDECYIVAEGSFGQGDPITEDVHCRMRKADSRKHGQPSTSANTFWQIEREGDQRIGDTLYWEESCRIKHLPTRLYLCVTKSSTSNNYIVTLKKRAFDKSDFDTLFNFYPLIREGDEMLFESYASIKHILTGQWLHLEKRERYVRKNFDPNAKGLAGLQWDSADLYKLSTRRKRGDYDTFAIQQVQEDLLTKFNYVAGLVPVLTAHIAHIQEDSVIGLTEKQSLRVRTTLTELRRWLVVEDSRATKNQQKLLRNLMVLEQLAEILKSGNHSDINKSQVRICKECYNVFKKYLEGDSRKNENYLARFIEFFQTQMRKGLNAEEVLVEIVQDNLSIISKMTETRMGQMIEQFCSTQDSRFLYFLSSLCVCSDRPIPSTQNRLLSELVMDKGKALFLRTEVVTLENGEKTVMYYRNGSSNKRSIRSLKPHVIAGRSRMSFVGKQTENNIDYELLEAQLHLFGKLCKGNNASAISSLLHSDSNPQGYIDFEQALMCAKDTSIDIQLRSKYVELILVMFVDVGDNRPFMDNLCYSFIYDDLTEQPYSDTGDDEVTALTEVKNEHFCDLKEWILTSISANAKLQYDARLSGDNHLLEQIIDILGHLVRFGYYDNHEDIDQSIAPLIQLLDGHTDVQSITNKDESSVWSVKLKAIEVMELFFRFKFYVKLQKFMHSFKLLHDDDTVHDMPAILKSLLTSQPDQHLYSKETRVSVLNRMKYLCDGQDRGGGFVPQYKLQNIPRLESVLLNLSTYDNDELVSASLGLLTDMYFFEEDLFKRADQAQLLISDESIRDYKKVNNEILPKLRQLLRVDTDHENQDVMIKYMHILSDLCILPVSIGVLELNSENQTMLDNFGLVSDILTYILSKGSDEQGLSGSQDTVKTAVREDLFSVALCLLRYLATHKLSVQKRLFDRIDDILDLKVPTPALADVADLITEVFTGGPELIFKISESHIERIFEIIVSCKNGIVQAQFMVTLQAMAKIEELDIPYGHNQALIIKNFCRLRDTICSEFMGEGQEMVKMRLEILKRSTNAEVDPDQQVLMSIADLLATCAESKDQFIESVCQNIFSMEELMEIMCSQLPPERKRPFVRYLILVYMKVEEDRPNPRVSSATLSQGSAIWQYLEHLAQLLQSVSDALCAIPSEEKAIVQSQFSTSNRRRNSFASQSPQYPGFRLPRSITTGIPNVTDDKGHLVPGLLEYLSDGIIPFLQAFYFYFFDPMESTTPEDRDSQYFISSQIAKSLTQLGEQLCKFLTNDNSLILYQSTITKLLSYEEINARANIDPKKTLVVQNSLESATASIAQQPKRSTLQRGGTLDHSNQSTVSKETLKDYKRQTKLNKSFNVFARNCYTAYCGKNEASEQIDSPVKDLEYSEEGEELPLGRSFQHLVEMFYNVHGNETNIIEPVAVRLIVQLEISSSRTEQLSELEQVRQNKLDIRCLQILRALVHNPIKLIDPELKDRDPIKFRRMGSVLVVPVQNCMQDFDNTIKRVIPLLSNLNESIAREALALMKVLLFSGNETVQDGIVQSVTETREEKLFISLKKKLQLASIQFKETKDLELQLAKRQKSKKKLADTGRIGSMEDPETSISRVAAKHPVSSNGKLDVVIEMETTTARKSSSDKLKKELSSDDSRPLIAEASFDIRRESVFTLDGRASPSRASTESLSLLSDLLTSDNNWTSLVLEVIGLMCDGQHHTLQDYLREQPDNFRSVNVIAECCDLLQTYTTDISRSENLEELHHILQSLIETCVGNFQNQKVIFYKHVIEPIDRILQIPVDGFHETCSSNDNCSECKTMMNVIQVKGSAVELLTIMLEETNSETPSIAKGIGSALDEDSLLTVIEEFHQWQSHPVVQGNQMDDDCQRGMFRAYHAITSLMRYRASTFSNRDDVKKRYKVCNIDKELPSECNDYTRTVEIHYEKEDAKPILTKVSFPFDSNDSLREVITEQVRWNVNRESMEDKQTSLLSLMPALKRDIIHQKKLKKLRFLKPLLAFHSIRTKALFLLTLLLNAFALFLYRVPDNRNNVFRENLTLINEDPDPDPSVNRVFKPEDDGDWYIPYLFYILGAIHLILSLIVVVEYFLISWPHFSLPQFFYTTWARITVFFSRDRNKPLARINQFTLLDVNIFGLSTLYMILFLLCSILSLIFYGYFYCICLLYIVVNNDILVRVLRAVTKNGIALLWVAVLGIIVLFIYAVISFVFYHNDFYKDDEEGDELYCSTLAECMYSMIRYGLIDNIGLLVLLRSTEYKVEVQPVRLIFDISIFIIITTIGLNIVFGIIVDTFGELREERSNIESEQRSKCFICDLPNYEFERRGNGFKNHIKLSHNMWDYVYYSLYLDSIDTGDHTAIQKYVYELIVSHETGFFPQEEAGSLPGEEDTTGQSLDHLQMKVEAILRRFKEKERQKSISSKREEQKRLEQEIIKHIHARP